MPKLKQLSVKQKKFVAGILKGKSQTQSYKDSYDTNSTYRTAQVEASKLANRPQIREVLEPLLKKHNITLDRALKPISEALDAVETKYDKDGNFIEQTPNHHVRLQASDRTLKLLGVNNEQSGATFINVAGDLHNELNIK